MSRQLQVKNGVAVNEWNGSGGMPVAPDGWMFVDVSKRPEAAIGDLYDSSTDTFTHPPLALIDPDDMPLTPREQRAFMKAVRLQVEKIK